MIFLKYHLPLIIFKYRYRIELIIPYQKPKNDPISTNSRLTNKSPKTSQTTTIKFGDKHSIRCLKTGARIGQAKINGIALPKSRENFRTKRRGAKNSLCLRSGF